MAPVRGFPSGCFISDRGKPQITNLALLTNEESNSHSLTAECRYQTPTQVHLSPSLDTTKQDSVLIIQNEDPVRIAVIGGTGISHLEHEGFTVSSKLRTYLIGKFLTLKTPFTGCCIPKY